MRILRRVLKDGVSAGAIAALVVFLLFAQGLMGGFAQGKMAGAAVDPFGILCISHGERHTPSDGPGQPDHGLCATLCQIAAGPSSALPGGHVEIVASNVPEATEVYFARKTVPRAIARRTFGQARAPPFFSV